MIELHSAAGSAIGHLVALGHPEALAALPAVIGPQAALDLIPPAGNDGIYIPGKEAAVLAGPSTLPAA